MDVEALFGRNFGLFGISLNLPLYTARLNASKLLNLLLFSYLYRNIYIFSTVINDTNNQSDEPSTLLTPKSYHRDVHPHHNPAILAPSSTPLALF